jgi:glutamine amidotransferase
VTKDYAEALEADGLVVPGVGAYAACMRGLHLVRGGTLVWDRLRKAAAGARHLRRHAGAVRGGRRARRAHRGHRRARRAVTRLEAPVVPAHGLEHRRRAPRGRGCSPGSSRSGFYFVHSYAAQPPSGAVEDTLTTSAEHGVRFAAGVERGVLSATQFHPGEERRRRRGAARELGGDL